MIFSLLVFAQLVGPGSAQRIGVNFPPPDDGNVLEVYPAVEGYTSSRYSVTVSQGTPVSSPVLFGENKGIIAINGDSDHWTQISFFGDPVEVVASLLTGDITDATIRPLSKSITPSVDTGADTVTFTITEYGQYYVDIGDPDNPLFIFASPIDDDVPDPEDPNVLYFAAGIHNLDPDYDPQVNEITNYTIPWGTHVYIEGGAYVTALFKVSGGSGPVRFRGRGTLSGDMYVWEPGHTENRKLIEAPSFGNGTVEIEGITFSNPPAMAVVVFDSGFVFHDTKTMGWHRESDGVRLQANSVASNNFIKINDDSIKMFGSNITVTDNVIWMMQTGSAIQLSWNSSPSQVGGLVKGMDIIHNIRPLGPTPGTYLQSINNSIVATRNINGASISGLVVEDVRIETQPWQLFGFSIKWDSTGFMSGQGDISGLTFRNWTTPTPYTLNYFNGNGENTGVIDDFVFDNVVVNGTPLDADDIGVSLICAGLADCESFTFP